MNQIFLGQPSEVIKTWFIETYPSWPTYTTLRFVDGTIQTKEISGVATQENIGVEYSFRDSNETLIYCQLGKNVTEISSSTFSKCVALTSINIPNSVTSIGGNAFWSCTNLYSIDIPNSVSSIGGSTFEYCQRLTSINIPNSVSSIGNGAFSECDDLPSITIPNSVRSIGYQAFFWCTSLTSVNIPSSVTSIGEEAFDGCTSLTSIVFEGRTMDQITAMANYPWNIPNTNAIIAGIS